MDYSLLIEIIFITVTYYLSSQVFAHIYHATVSLSANSIPISQQHPYQATMSVSANSIPISQQHPYQLTHSFTMCFVSFQFFIADDGNIPKRSILINMIHTAVLVLKFRNMK